MRDRVSALLIVGTAVMWLSGAAPLLGEGGKRPFRVEDLFQLERLSGATFAPDGRAIAFQRYRPERSQPAAAQSSLVFEAVRSDVWLQERPGAAPRNLTRGGDDASGAWAPRWAPDGTRLAFLSSRGGGVRLWVWEQVTNQTRPVSPSGVKYLLSGSTPSFVWVDAQHLLYAAPETDAPVPPESWLAKAMHAATNAWARAARGEMTASVVDGDKFVYERFRLMTVDVTNGKTQMVGAVADSPLRYHWWLSPTGRAIAHVEPVTQSYGYASIVKMGFPASVALRHLDGRPVVLDQPLPANIQTQSIAWSPDGEEVAFFANGPGPINPLLLYGESAAEVMPDPIGSMTNPAKLYRVHVGRGQIQQIETGDIDLGELGAPPFQWLASGELLFQAPRRQFGVTAWPPASRGAAWGGYASTAVPFGPPAKHLWWVLDREGQTRELLPADAPSFTRLDPSRGGKMLVGVAKGDLWEVDPATGMVSNLTAQFGPRVTAVTVPAQSTSSYLLLYAAAEKGGTFAEGESGGGRVSRWVFDLTSRTAQAVGAPPFEAGVVAVSPDATRVIFGSDDRRGAFLWRSAATSATGGVEQVAEANVFVRDIAKPECRIFDYKSVNREPLKAGLCLPIGYHAGKHAPLVVHVYAGTNTGKVGMSRLLSPNAPLAGLSETLTSAGYAMLFPSMPHNNVPGLDRDEGASLLALTNGVLPAIDEAARLGLIDSDRVFLMGASTGGWSTLGIITQTTRFKAAVAEAGYTDRIFSGNGAAIGRAFYRRYTENLADSAAPDRLYKVGRPTDVPWWRDGDLERRNDPMTYLDRVQTPLMLIHNDLDGLDISTSEDVFRGLASQRKPVRFVRYWGEGHGLTTPINVQDYWRRILAWFDGYGDLRRDSEGHLMYDATGMPRSREGAPALAPEDFARFGPTTDAPVPHASR